MIKQSLMPKKRSFSDKILLIIKGFAMGTVNKIPGVSGGIWHADNTGRSRLASIDRLRGRRPSSG